MRKKKTNLLTILNPLISAFLRLYGLKPQTVEINPGTVIHFWAPSQVVESYKYRQVKPATKRTSTILCRNWGAGVAPQVFVPDPLHFGGSRTDWSPKFHADCLAKGLKLLGVKSCTVVGRSYGGIVGSKMAESDLKLVKCRADNTGHGTTTSHENT
ncbi:uncharacterized protein LOC112094210 [Morus notabilis]|uniref:uncharacterized protein LOC112094210 n=1 Tax=Morus notabilis TaxID=981085 RepID=UPI000CED0766|nr:uncharacterized protein LOC112094210 [Morus notabilis]